MLFTIWLTSPLQKIMMDPPKCPIAPAGWQWNPADVDDLPKEVETPLQFQKLRNCLVMQIKGTFFFFCAKQLNWIMDDQQNPTHCMRLPEGKCDSPGKFPGQSDPRDAKGEV